MSERVRAESGLATDNNFGVQRTNDLAMRCFIQLRTGQTRRWATRLVILSVVALNAPVAHAQWLNHPTPGIPRLPDGTPNLAAPTPRTSNGNPDLSATSVADS